MDLEAQWAVGYAEWDANRALSPARSHGGRTRSQGELQKALTKPSNTKPFRGECCDCTGVWKVTRPVSKRRWSRTSSDLAKKKLHMPHEKEGQQGLNLSSDEGMGFTPPKETVVAAEFADDSHRSRHGFEGLDIS